MQNNTNFLFLAPKDDLGKSIYTESLDFALKERNVKNIVVTGSYGSGKSSIIHAYIKNKECALKNVVLVSLASFNTKQKHKVDNKIQENEKNEIFSTFNSTGQVNKYLDNL
ncbi:hypothetical protein [Thorsellia anophelis]|uniref:YobI-like P-loop NTPase domain-containing protein n=1 Tax=Thorsellia anophelis DSM 18579 TaxID=1123402 RepID=A0A1I0CWK1_9GAMM|nr:hypothetical protein [Thorsellia anophelis]SET24130.1 hypothetical protein SAMN02583745_01777 [Thorsellia anophelis DSM 18579]